MVGVEVRVGGAGEAVLFVRIVGVCGGALDCGVGG
jgi:hypothetical protein